MEVLCRHRENTLHFSRAERKTGDFSSLPADPSLLSAPYRATP
jgi:hypothetical protein